MFFWWGDLRIVKATQFDMHCHAYIQRAAAATNVETAKAELEKAIEYMEKNNLTDGTVSIIFKDPRNDVGFWYNIMKDAHKELESLSENGTQLEKTNYLMKMRKSFITVGLPVGISIYPNNVFYFWWSIISLFGMIVFGILWYHALDD